MRDSGPPLGAAVLGEAGEKPVQQGRLEDVINKETMFQKGAELGSESMLG